MDSAVTSKNGKSNTTSTKLSVWEKYFTIQYFETEIKWDAVIGLAFIHVAYVYSSLTFPVRQEWPYVLFQIWFGFFSGLGITAGVHRLWCHKAYKANFALRVLLMCGFMTAGQNSIYKWSRDHRLHHKHTDTEADPYNSKRGFFFSHVGWLMLKKKPIVIQKGKTLDLTDLLDDPVVRFQEKYFWPLKIMLCFIIPCLVGHYIFGVSWFLSAELNFVRYTISLNATWTVNSLAHIYGYQPYDRTISPKQNLFVSIITGGEGWHNYHHAFPWDYRASENNFCNATNSIIHFFAYFGWAYGFKIPSNELVEKTVKRYGDGAVEHMEVPCPNDNH